MAAPSQLVGQILGHYRILEQIGAGGMGVVYRAHDERLDRDVAVKVLPPGALADEAARKRFRKEALALSRLNHPNIAMIFDFDAQEGMDFLVTEYISGTTLDASVGPGFLPEKQVMRLGSQLAEGLAAAHEQGVVHRDLKPSNLRITPDGRLKILDFGIAKLLTTGEREATETLTEAQGVTGTLPYMAPEQLRGEQPDSRTDIYAAGVVLYEMATGRRPFEQRLSTALVNEIINKPPIPLRQIHPKLSSKLEDIVLKCLEKESENRYQSAKELAIDLRRLAFTSTAQVMVAPAELRPRLWRALAVAGIAGLGGLALLLAFNVGGWRERLLGTQGPTIRSIAVLPLENLSRDPEQEYFADGMTEALIANLGKISGFRVISRQSVMQYKSSKKPLPEIARELNVDAALEGAVERSGDRVRVSVHLDQVSPETQLWANQYERSIRDVMALENEIARAVADETQTRLMRQQRTISVSARAIDPQAQDDYLRGRYFFSRGKEPNLRTAVEYYKRAIAKDPGYAPAYAGLADAYFALGIDWGIPGHSESETLMLAKTAVAKALELDPGLAEAHVSHVWGLLQDWNWQEAEKEARLVVTQNPNYAEGHSTYSMYLSAVGRHEEAISQMNYAIQLDPLNPEYKDGLGWTACRARQYDLAIKQFESEDDNIGLGLVYIFKKMYPQAIGAVEKDVRKWGGDAFHISTLAMAYGFLGRRHEAQKMVDELEATARQHYVPPIFFMHVYIGLGDKEKALTWTERAYEDHDQYLFWLKVSPSFDALRSEPRFQVVLRRMNFPP